MGELRAVRGGRRRSWTGAVPAVTGLVVLTAWALFFVLAHAQYAPVEAAYQAHLDTLDNPPILQDPPLEVSRSEFAAAVATALAAPVAVVLLLTGLRSARNSNGVRAVRVLGWTTFGVGALGVFPALIVSLFGLIAVVFDGLALSA